jgi:hypothetical protein
MLGIPSHIRFRLPVLLILVHLGGLLTFEYWERIERPQLVKRMQLHQQIVTRQAPYQYRYRVLLPWAAEVTASVLHWLPGSGDPLGTRVDDDNSWLAIEREWKRIGMTRYGPRSFALSYIFLNLAGFLLFLYGMQKLLEQWNDIGTSLFGTTLSALVVSFMFRDHYYHPWSIWEAAFFSLGLLCLVKRQYLRFACIALLGSLNRETSAFLVLASAFAALPTRPVDWKATLGRRDVQASILTGALWLAVYGLLHAAVGHRPTTFTLERAIRGNLENWPRALMLNWLLLGPAWWLVFVGIRHAPVFVRRVAMIIPPYLLLLVAIGYWWEIRYWMPILPIIVPLGIAGGRHYFDQWKGGKPTPIRERAPG